MSALALALTACIPYPHRANLTPGVTGSLKASDGSISGRALRLVAATESVRSCDGDHREFKTAADGSFYIAPVRTFSMVMVVMGHSFFPWALCIEDEGRWSPIHTGKIYTLVDTGPAMLIDMECSQEKTRWSCNATEDFAPSPERIADLERRHRE